MFEAVAKNLWLLLTIVMPGLFTYGAWRLLLLLEPSARLDSNALSQIDGSAIASGSIIIAIALLQQAFAIAIEAALASLAKARQAAWPNYYSLLCERFELDKSDRLNEKATRVIGNFFLSLNMSIGLALLLLYFLAYEGKDVCHWIPMGITVLLIATLVTTVFRMLNATWVIKACKE